MIKLLAAVIRFRLEPYNSSRAHVIHCSRIVSRSHCHSPVTWLRHTWSDTPCSILCSDSMIIAFDVDFPAKTTSKHLPTTQHSCTYLPKYKVKLSSINIRRWMVQQLHLCPRKAQRDVPSIHTVHIFLRTGNILPPPSFHCASSPPPKGVFFNHFFLNCVSLKLRNMTLCYVRECL